MAKTRSCAKVLYRSWNNANCGNAGKHEEDGKWWCNVHLPSNVAKKKTARDARWKHEDAISCARAKVHDAEREVVEVALEGHRHLERNPTREAVTALIAAKKALTMLLKEVL